MLARPASTKNGVSQRNICANLSPNGTPSAAAAENAVITMPIPAARRCGGTTSPMMDMIIAMERPPKVPLSARAINKRGGVRGKTAGQRAENKSAVSKQQQFSAIETVDERRSQQAENAGADGVSRDERAECSGPDVQIAHELRPERHKDHEIHDVRELHGCQQQ